MSSQNCAISLADNPHAHRVANSTEPEHALMITGSTPASSNARRTPTSEAVAPLPPDDTTAIRLLDNSGTANRSDPEKIGADGGGTRDRRGPSERHNARTNDRSSRRSVARSFARLYPVNTGRRLFGSSRSRKRDIPPRRARREPELPAVQPRLQLVFEVV